MTINIGIVPRPESFSDRWIEYCSQNNIGVRLLNPDSCQIIEQVRGLDGFLWHWSQDDYLPSLYAKQLIASLSFLGVRVFPDINTCWHFDDKVAQKYLLETISAPLPPTWIFYSEDEAMNWISTAAFPKVFKLRKGSGSSNVSIVRSAQDARKLCRLAFSSGFSPIAGYTSDFRTKVRKTQQQKNLFDKIKRAPGIIKSIIRRKKEFPPEKNYVYFQEYVDNNSRDTRITIIGGRGFGFQRENRPGDFRASGSGLIDYQPEKIDPKMISLAFDISQKIGMQSAAMDFVYDAQKRPILLEVSYGFVANFVHQCPGYWDAALSWHPGHVWPQDAILEDLLQRVIPEIARFQ